MTFEAWLRQTVVSQDLSAAGEYPAYMMQLFEKSVGEGVLSAIWWMVLAVALGCSGYLAVVGIWKRGFARSLRDAKRLGPMFAWGGSVIAALTVLCLLQGPQRTPSFAISIVLGIVGVALVAILAVLPVIAFLFLFTTVGMGLRRWLHNKPARKDFRFGVRSLLLGVTLIGVALGMLCWIVPSHDPAAMFGLWVVLSLPLTFGMAVLRNVLDSLTERRLRRERLPAAITVEDGRTESTEPWSLRHAEPRAHELPVLKVKPTLTQADNYGTM